MGAVAREAQGEGKDRKSCNRVDTQLEHDQREDNKENLVEDDDTHRMPPNFGSRPCRRGSHFGPEDWTKTDTSLADP
jgi:hypothetical protein